MNAGRNCRRFFSAPAFPFTRSRALPLFIFALFGALLISLLVGMDPAERKPLRVGVHMIRPDADVLAQAAELGVEAVVLLFPWREIEPTQGYFFWQMADEAVVGAAHYGVELIVRLDQPPEWALREKANVGEPPVDVAAYERFVRSVASRYQGRIAGYILWNEPNLALEWNDRPPDPVGYVTLLQAGHRGVKAGDPAAKVISAGLAPTNTDDAQAMDDRRFLEEMYRQGAGRFFDVLAAHAYGFGRPPDAPFLETNGDGDGLDGLVFQRVAALRAIMERNGDARKPVYITEMGWTVEAVAHSAWQEVTPQQQADYLIRALDLAEASWPWLDLATIWNLGGETHPEWRGYSLLTPEGEPRPAYHALQERLAGRRSPAAHRHLDSPQRVQVVAEDVVIHLGDKDLPDPWVPLYRGLRRSPRWEGVFYLDDPGSREWRLSLRIMQSNFWSNRIWINGHPLSEPMPIEEFGRTWVMHSWRVPAEFLQPGLNRIVVVIAHAPPRIQDRRFTYDDIQFTDVQISPAPLDQ
ncbi:MAG: hypothetical protein NZ553_02920 [Caldilinea sp.]|nr:hypothetical protein [Caldilinea sp.]MDW8439403.1 hypothetical protein [Caldilineaceae bacterium]